MQILKRGCLAALALVISVMCLTFAAGEVSAHGANEVDIDKNKVKDELLPESKWFDIAATTYSSVDNTWS